MQAELIDVMGNDLTVVNSARVSFNKESKFELEYGAYEEGVPAQLSLSERDTKLVNYLASHGHWTPFSHPQVTFRYTVPIFVARQEFKHIVGFTRNEVSRRYVDDTPEFYYPEVWRSRPDGSVKQGSGSDQVTAVTFTNNVESYIIETGNLYQLAVEQCQQVYQAMIDGGVAPEQARMILPQSMMTSYYITGSLAAYARFYNQRSDAHAQVEIQYLAGLVGDQMSRLFPVSWQALTGE